MDKNEFPKLDKNLTRSAKKAKPYDVRGMVGYTESDQGFFSIFKIPFTNPLRNKESLFGEFIDDVFKLSEDHKELKLSYEALQKELNDYKEAQEELQNQNKKVTDELARRISAIEAFRID